MQCCFVVCVPRVCVALLLLLCVCCFVARVCFALWVVSRSLVLLSCVLVCGALICRCACVSLCVACVFGLLGLCVGVVVVCFACMH